MNIFMEVQKKKKEFVTDGLKVMDFYFNREWC